MNRFTDDVLIDEVQAMVAAIMCHADAPFDVGDACKHTSLNIILRITYSLRLNTPLPDLECFFPLRKKLATVSNLRPEHSHLPKVIDEIFFLLGQPNIPDFFPILRHFPIPPPLSWEIPASRSRVEKDKIISEILDNHKKTYNPDVHRDFLDHLIANSGDLTDLDILEIAWDQIAAGTDTSSTTILWFVLLLARYPHVQQKLHAEMDKVCGLRWPTLEDLPALPYLNATILEVFRFKPVGPLHVPRYVTKTLSMKGMTIPVGMKIL